MYEKLLGKIKQLQDRGVPLLWAKDPLTKLPSVSLTLMLISFVFVVFGLVNSWAQLVKGVDVDNATELLIITASLYFGRSVSKKFKDDK